MAITSRTLDTLLLLLDLEDTELEFLEDYVSALECSQGDCVSRLLVELRQRPSEAPRHGPARAEPLFSPLVPLPN